MSGRHTRESNTRAHTHQNTQTHKYTYTYKHHTHTNACTKTKHIFENYAMHVFIYTYTHVKSTYIQCYLYYVHMNTHRSDIVHMFIHVYTHMQIAHTLICMISVFCMISVLCTCAYAHTSDVVHRKKQEDGNPTLGVHRSLRATTSGIVWWKCGLSPFQSVVEGRFLSLSSLSLFSFHGRSRRTVYINLHAGNSIH